MEVHHYAHSKDAMKSIDVDGYGQVVHHLEVDYLMTALFFSMIYPDPGWEDPVFSCPNLPQYLFHPFITHRSRRNVGGKGVHVPFGLSIPLNQPLAINGRILSQYPKMPNPSYYYLKGDRG